MQIFLAIVTIGLYSSLSDNAKEERADKSGRVATKRDDSIRAV